MDIVGLFPVAPLQKRFILAAIDYFTKWLEAKAYANAKVVDVKNFLWKYIICRFDILRAIVTENEMHFESQMVQKLCDDFNIKHFYLTRGT